jgi:Heterokaryon incompatibility protein (HET)
MGRPDYFRQRGPSSNQMAEGNDGATIVQRETPGVSIPVINKGDQFAERKISVCYFDSGKLFREDIFPMNFQYLAISHVWGQPRWQSVPGIDFGQVLVSDSKVRFIAEVLPGIVKEDYFWMDILCVDQRDKEARIAITQYIPRIFRHAQRTIFVKDDGEIQSCCAQAMEFNSMAEDNSLREMLMVHREQAHPGQYIDERMLTRLWILEETVLSNTIQFVNGRSNNPIEPMKSTAASGIVREDTTIQVTTTRFILKLREIAKAWAGAYHPWESTPKLAVVTDSLAFIRGYFENSTIQRSGVNVRPLHPFPEAHTFYAHIFSTRRTSKSRDFILATMPQYSFYRVPTNAKGLSFGQLFKDCVCQLMRAGFPVQPIIPRQPAKILDLAAPEYQFRYDADDDTAFPAGREETLHLFPLPRVVDGPEPACLGDLVKLFCGPRIVWEFYPPLDASDAELEKYLTFPAQDISNANPFSAILPGKKTWIKVDYPENWRIISPSLNTRVSIKRICKVDTVKEIEIHTESELLKLLSEVTSTSHVVWASSMLGEVHETVILTEIPDEGYNPPNAIRLAAQFLRSWWLQVADHTDATEIEDSHSLNQFSTDLDFSSPERIALMENIVRLAALITCGLGLSAFEWSKHVLMPAIVSVAGTRIIALIPTSLSRSEGIYDSGYWLVGAIMPGERWTLVALDHIDGGGASITPCLFPWDVALKPTMIMEDDGMIRA